MDLTYYLCNSRGANKRATSVEKRQSVRQRVEKKLLTPVLLITLLIASGIGVILTEDQEVALKKNIKLTQNNYPTAIGGLSAEKSSSPLVPSYQPVLIGFRCEASHDLTAGGVSVVEANRPVTLTLFGESFTTNTIIAFTTEFRQDSDKANDLNKDNKILENRVVSLTIGQHETLRAQSQQVNPNYVDKGSLPKASSVSGMKQTKRRSSKSFDCTDYNRVVSYKLSEENILSPNVAYVVATLPELAPGSGLYYYFCIKQSKMTDISGSSGPNEQTRIANESLIWVHQGDDWWVTLKVEPPLLSMANDCVLIVLLLFLSAVTSGLNLGLMSLDMNELAVISSCGDQRERSYARTIAPLRKRGNFLLCSLLLGNVMVNSTLTVILEEMTSGVVAVIGSTLAIVILGEIVPQALCARHGLAIGARTIYMTYAFMLLTFPLSYPISCLLDYVLGEEKGNLYDRERLMEFIKITGHHTQLEADEVAIISGALKLKKIKVDQIMTRIEDVFMLPIDCQLNRETIVRIIEKGYSRIPIYDHGDRKQIVALILAKDLALLDPDDHTPLASMLMYCKHPLIFIEDDATLDVALNEFKTGKSHMAVVRQIYDDGEIDKYYEAIGVVTLEDVIEEVLQVEINDETDTLSDNRRKRRRTEAQVVHLVDELALAGSSQSFPSTNKEGYSSTAEESYSCFSKQVQTSLSSHLSPMPATTSFAHRLAGISPYPAGIGIDAGAGAGAGAGVDLREYSSGDSLTLQLHSSGSSSGNTHFHVPPETNSPARAHDLADPNNANQQQEGGILSRAAHFLGGILL